MSKTRDDGEIMRARNIKPGFFRNEDLGSLPPLARLLFIGLLCLADRDGRLDDRPARIKIEVLPYDDCDIDGLLNLLRERTFIKRYAIGSRKYIQIANFHKHNKPYHNEPPSEIPPPPEDQNDQGTTDFIPTSEGGTTDFIPTSEEGTTDFIPTSYSLRLLSSNLLSSNLVSSNNVYISPELSLSEVKNVSDDAQHRPQLLVDDPVVIQIPLIHKRNKDEYEEFAITRSMINEWVGLFPAVDVMQALRDIRAWNIANPRNRKTKRGVMRHIVGWLSRLQDRARKTTAPESPSHKAPSSAFDALNKIRAWQRERQENPDEFVLPSQNGKSK